MRSRALPFAAVALMALHCRPTTVTPAPAAPGAAGARDEERLVLPADFERSGRIAFAPAGYGPVGDETVAPCEVVSAPDGVASLAASVPARLVAWHVAPGEAVRRGQVVVTLDSREVAELRNQVEREQIRVGALTAALAREEGLLSEGATSARDAHAARTELSLARAAVSSARRSLAVAGAAESGPAGRFVLRSPIDGTVVRRDGVLGAVFDPAGAAGVGTSLAVVTDLTALRIAVLLPENASDVPLGAVASVVLRGRAGLIPCHVVWRDPTLSRETRTRAVHLRPDAPTELSLALTGTARLVRAGAAGVLVPESALYREGDLAWAFVRRAPGRYEPRPVVVGRGGALVEVVSGLTAGEEVVVVGTFIVASEYSRSRQARGA